tara:strand:+ start:74818 stop:75708 length:891 start_codon:yes stop_codon:yes gene_type:complete
MKPIAEDLLGYESKEISVGPFTMRYLDEGAGEETLLCVHGNPTWSFYYRGVIERFSPSRRVVAVDHLGCGRSDKPSRGEFPYRMSDHRDNLVSLIDQLDLNRITLVAHDWGGAIGLASLVERPEHFQRIVLLNTGAFPPPYVPLRIAALRFPVLGTAAIRGLNAFAAPAVSMAMSRSRMADDVAAGLLAPYDSWTNRVAIDGFVRDIPLTSGHPTFQTLQQLETDLSGLPAMPKLLVWGMKDWCFRPECLHRLQKLWPDANAVEISDAGHYVLEDAPGETLDAIANFLNNAPQIDG